MKILRVLNTNSILICDENGDEVVLLGAGLGFKQKPGDTVAEEKIEKCFVLRDRNQQNRFQELVNSIPPEYILVAERCISLGKNLYDMKLNESIHISLADHIHNAVSSMKAGFSVPNSLLLDIKRYYPKEFEIGQQALLFIQKEFDCLLPEDEAGFIAMHFVNAQYGNTNNNIKKTISFVHEINDLILTELGITPDENSLNYYRYMTHLKFFANRVLQDEHYQEEDQVLLDAISSKFPREYSCSRKIAHYIADKYGYCTRDNELLYLTIHLAHLTSPNC